MRHGAEVTGHAGPQPSLAQLAAHGGGRLEIGARRLEAPLVLVRGRAAGEQQRLLDAGALAAEALERAVPVRDRLLRHAVVEVVVAEVDQGAGLEHRVAGLARQGQRLGQDRAPLLEVADREHGADAVQHAAAHRRVARLLGLLERAREQAVGLGRAAERGARARGEAQDGGAGRRIAGRAAGDQRDRVVGHVAQHPERAQTRAR